MKNTRLIKVKVDDPLLQEKQSAIAGLTRMADLIRETKKDIENQLIIVFTIFAGSFVSFFITNKNFLLVFSIANIILIMLIWAINKQRRDLQGFWLDYFRLEKICKDLGLQLPFKERP